MRAKEEEAERRRAEEEAARLEAERQEAIQEKERMERFADENQKNQQQMVSCFVFCLSFLLFQFFRHIHSIHCRKSPWLC